MLSYRHSFHAGNFADVLKHIVQVEILEHLLKKDKAFTYIDTHAGAGLYSLTSEPASRLNEAAQGISRLQRNDWPELASYFAAINAHNPQGSADIYPGSPMIARHFLREQDRGWLYELHPEDYQLLRQNMGRDRRLQLRQEDGLQGLLALLPPASRRGLVLIDPSYEIKADYQAVLEAVVKAHRKSATISYAIWYPVVDRQRIQRLQDGFRRSGIRDIQCFELGRMPDSDAQGMTASGVIVINPPWTLMQKMAQLLPRLASILSADDAVHFSCEQLVDE